MNLKQIIDRFYFMIREVYYYLNGLIFSALHWVPAGLSTKSYILSLEGRMRRDSRLKIQDQIQQAGLTAHFVQDCTKGNAIDLALVSSILLTLTAPKNGRVLCLWNLGPSQGEKWEQYMQWHFQIIRSHCAFSLEILDISDQEAVNRYLATLTPNRPLYSVRDAGMISVEECRDLNKFIKELINIPRGKVIGEDNRRSSTGILSYS